MDAPYSLKSAGLFFKLFLCEHIIPDIFGCKNKEIFRFDN